MTPDSPAVEPKFCDYCGHYIVEVNNRCPARPDGHCQEEIDVEVG